MKNSNELLAKAKAGLILDQPFFASLLLTMPMVEDNSIKTMATNGERIKYNAEFMNSLTLQELTFVLAHETMHCVFQHMHRLGDKNHNKWNIACDHIINDILTKERVGVMPKGCLLDKKLIKDGGETAEGVYAILPKECEDKGAGDDGGAMDSMESPGKDAAEVAQKAAEMRVRVIQARNAAKMQGKLSAGLERMVSELTKTETDWRTVLRRFLSERCKSELSYARPNRRSLGGDTFLPSRTGEKMGAIVVGIDCSGSIGESELKMFGAEVTAIFEDVKPSEIKIVYFDSKVLKTDTFTGEDTVTLKPVGGGGTHFGPIIEAVNEYETAPAAVVILTDLCGPHAETAPSYPVLWACTETRYEEPPFGETIVIKAKS